MSASNSRIRDYNTYHHLMSRIAHKVFFMTDEVRNDFIEMIRRAADFCGIKLIAWCIMANHFHILAYLPMPEDIGESEILRRFGVLKGAHRLKLLEEELSAKRLGGDDGEAAVQQVLSEIKSSMYDIGNFVKIIKQWLTQEYNRRYSHVGTLWEGVYKDVPVKASASELGKRAGYIHLNPIRAAIVPGFSDYPWSSYAALCRGDAGKKVLVLEKRPVVGGNVRCEIDAETGIEVHVYGSHIFHTHIPEVWEFVNRFVTFNGYQHKVLANYKGRIYHLPLGLTLVNKFFSVELRPDEVKGFMADEKNSAAIFDAFFRGYTSKQWGKSPEEIDPSIIRRVPVRSNYDTNYFNDYNQGIPLDGYNAMFDRMLDHPNISVRCNAVVRLENGMFFVDGESLPDVSVYYSGPIDALFGYKFGALPWRTLRFETETVDVADYQGTSVVNYTEAGVPYTRIHEFKHYHPEGALAAKGLVAGAKAWGWDSSRTVIMREYSAQWKPGDEPYYPIDGKESRELLQQYQEELRKLNELRASRHQSQIVCGGRLGEYKYYDMDKSIEAALKVVVSA